MGTNPIAMPNNTEKLSMDQYLAKNEMPDMKTVATIKSSVAQISAANERSANMDINSVGSYGQIAGGKRINSAADDASGLAVANKLESQERGINAGAENIKQADDALKISDKAMEGITDYLQRIRELSVKASNGLLNDSDKAAIQTEVSQLLQGIQDISKTTHYNEQNLLDGSMATLDVAANPDGKGMSIKMTNGTLETLGIEDYDVTKDFDISRIDAALEKVSSDRSSVGAASNALEYAYNSNMNTAENVLASRSRIEDLDIEKAVSDQKKNEVINDYQILLQRKKEEQDSLVTKLFQ